MKEEKEYQLVSAKNGKYEFKKIRSANNSVGRPADS